LDDRISPDADEEQGLGAGIIVADRISDAGHEMPETWLRARVRGWMQLVESGGMDFWIGTYTDDGKWIWCSSANDTWAPSVARQEYARRVCAVLNREAAHGGAWLVGWTKGGREFYLLWKDKDGDIQIPIECNKPFFILSKWSPQDWVRQAEVAIGIWKEWKRDLELADGQEKKVAQGEPVSPLHFENAPEQTI
jgi:hypothetical protein